MSMRSGQPGINGNEYSQLPIPVPPLPEQRGIAAALGDVDRLLGGLDRLIAKKRDLKQAAMQQLLTGQTRLPGYQGEWKSGQLGSFVRSHNSGVYKKSELYGQGCNIVGVSDIYGVDSIDGQRFALVPLTAAERAKHTLKANDLLYGESSLVREGIARTVYVTEKGVGTAFAWHTRRYSVDQSVLISSFLYYYLQGRRARQHMMDNCIQTAITGINTVAYFACPVLLPSIPEQTAIAEVLTDMGAELSALEQRREKTRDLKQAMMQELLIGKTRLI
jgi:type I restriction enzyme, S subunit